MEQIQQHNDKLNIDTTKTENEKTESTAEVNNSNNTKKNAGHRIENGYELVLL